MESGKRAVRFGPEQGPPAVRQEVSWGGAMAAEVQLFGNEQGSVVIPAGLNSSVEGT